MNRSFLRKCKIKPWANQYYKVTCHMSTSDAAWSNKYTRTMLHDARINILFFESFRVQRVFFAVFVYPSTATNLHQIAFNCIPSLP